MVPQGNLNTVYYSTKEHLTELPDFERDIVTNSDALFEGSLEFLRVPLGSLGFLRVPWVSLGFSSVLYEFLVLFRFP